MTTLPAYKQAIDISDLRTGDFVYEMTRGRATRVITSRVVRYDNATGAIHFADQRLNGAFGLGALLRYRTGVTAIIKRRDA